MKEVHLLCRCPEQTFSIEPVYALYQQVIHLCGKEPKDEANTIILRIIRRKASVSALSNVYM